MRWEKIKEIIKKEATFRKIIAGLVYLVLIVCAIKLFMFMFVGSVAGLVVAAIYLEEAGKPAVMNALPIVMKKTLFVLVFGLLTFVIHATITGRWLKRGD